MLFNHVAGDIHIWDQESGALLHHVRAQANVGDLTCIAWNHAFEDPYMFATGSHDGAVRIWTKRPEEEISDHASEPCFAGTDIPRTSSPFELLEHEKRSDNLATRQDYFNLRHGSSGDSTAHLLQEHVAAFAQQYST